MWTHFLLLLSSTKPRTRISSCDFWILYGHCLHFKIIDVATWTFCLTSCCGVQFSVHTYQVYNSRVIAALTTLCTLRSLTQITHMLWFFPVNKEKKIPVIRLFCINWSTSRYHLVGNFGISVFILGNITKRKIKVSYRVVVCKRTDVLNVKIILLGVSFLYPITCLNTNSMQKYDFIMQTHIYK